MTIVLIFALIFVKVFVLGVLVDLASPVSVERGVGVDGEVIETVVAAGEKALSHDAFKIRRARHVLGLGDVRLSTARETLCTHRRRR